MLATVIALALLVEPRGYVPFWPPPGLMSEEEVRRMERDEPGKLADRLEYAREWERAYGRARDQFLDSFVITPESEREKMRNDLIDTLEEKAGLKTPRVYEREAEEFADKREQERIRALRAAQAARDAAEARRTGKISPAPSDVDRNDRGERPTAGDRTSDRRDRAQAEKVRAERTRAEKEQAERERADKEKADRDKAEKEAREKAEKEKAEKEKAEREKEEKEKKENENKEKEDKEKEAVPVLLGRPVVDDDRVTPPPPPRLDPCADASCIREEKEPPPPPLLEDPCAKAKCDPEGPKQVGPPKAAPKDPCAQAQCLEDPRPVVVKRPVTRKPLGHVAAPVPLDPRPRKRVGP